LQAVLLLQERITTDYLFSKKKSLVSIAQLLCDAAFLLLQKRLRYNAWDFAGKASWIAGWFPTVWILVCWVDIQVYFEVPHY